MFVDGGLMGIILFGGLGALRKHKCKSVDFTAIRFGSALKPNTPEVIIASQTAVSSGRSAPVYIVTEEVRDLLREQDDGLPSMLEAIRLAELITIKASISSIARAVRVCRDYQGMPRYPVLEEWVRYLVIQNKFSLKNKRHVGKLIRLCRSVMPNGTYYNDVNIRKVLKYIQDHPKP
jgi:hypothetical protein